MNAHRIILALSLVAILTLASVGAGDDDRRFLRSIGTINQSDSQVRAVVTAAASTNAHPDVSVAWRSGDVTESVSKPMVHSRWFVFVEEPGRVWVFDGSALSLLERRDRSVNDLSSAEVFKSCPKPVRDALPEHVQKRYFK